MSKEDELARLGFSRKKAPPSVAVECQETDPEGWMAERPTYWLDLPDPAPPTRLAWLRHRASEAASIFGGWPDDPWKRVGDADAEWRRLSEQALGRLPPAPGELAKRARSAEPNARKPARKPKAYSPRNAGPAAG